MDRTVKVGVVGCGAIAQRRHLPEYQSRGDVEIVAVCDPSFERAEQIRSAFGAAHAFTQLEEMLALPELDAISICTPNQYHAPMSIIALNAGKHVLCEKPMATTLDDAKAMIAAADQAGVYLMIGMNQRFMAPHIKAKEVVDSGRLGRVLTFATTFGHSGPENWSIDGGNSWFFNKEKAFVGALGDLGSHKADLIGWLLSDPIKEISAITGTLDKSIQVDDNSIFVMRTERGAIGTLTASWTYYSTEVNSTVLNCERGRILIGTDPVFNVIVEHRDGMKEYYETGKMQTNEQGGQTKSGVIDQFIDGIVSGKGHSIDGREALRSLEAIFAGMQSAETGQRVRLPLGS